MTVYCVWSFGGEETNLEGLFSTEESASSHVDALNKKHGESYYYDQEELDKYATASAPPGNPPNCLNPFHEEDGTECPCMKK